jgi:aerobic C4-dicarboxylate transport protein
MNDHSAAIAGHQPPKRRPLSHQLWLWVAVAMVIGIILGVVNPNWGILMKPFGDAFVRLIAMTIGVLVFCTVVQGIGRMGDLGRLGRIAVKAMALYFVVSMLAEIGGLLVGNILQPGAGMNLDITSISSHAVDEYLGKELSFVPFVMSIIPTSLVGAFVNGNILQVVFLAVLCGVALIWIGHKAQPMLDVIDSATRMIFSIVNMIMWLAPVAAFGAIAFTVGKLGFASLVPLGKLIIDFYLLCLLFLLGVGFVISRVCGFKLLQFIRYFWNECLVVFATSSSEVVMPITIEKLTYLGCEGNVVGLLTPLGYAFNNLGACLYLPPVILFLSQALHVPLSISHQMWILLLIAITARGAAGVAYAAFVVLVTTLSMDGSIPVASAVIILGIHRLLSQMFCVPFILVNAMCTILVGKWENAVDFTRMAQVLESQEFEASEELALH